jgi:hypothetical protein
MSCCLSADFKTSMWFRISAWFWITLFQSILQPVISKWKFFLPSDLLHDQYSNSESLLSAWMCCSLGGRSVWYTLCVYHTSTKLWRHTATDRRIVSDTHYASIIRTPNFRATPLQTPWSTCEYTAPDFLASTTDEGSGYRHVPAVLRPVQNQ